MYACTSKGTNTCMCQHTGKGVYDHTHCTGCVQLAMTKVLIARHCLDCCLPYNTASGAHWQSRGQLWAGPNTALLLTSGPMPQPQGQLRGYPITVPPTIVDPLLQPWGCPVDPTPAMLWPKANRSLGVVVNVS